MRGSQGGLFLARLSSRAWDLYLMCVFLSLVRGSWLLWLA